MKNKTITIDKLKEIGELECGQEYVQYNCALNVSNELIDLGVINVECIIEVNDLSIPCGSICCNFKELSSLEFSIMDKEGVCILANFMKSNEKIRKKVYEDIVFSFCTEIGCENGEIFTGE